MKPKLNFRLGLMIVMGLALFAPSLALAEGENWQFHQFENEGLIPLDQIGPRQITGEYMFGDNKLTLEISADKKSLGIAPQSSIELTVRLLRDGQPLGNVSKLADDRKSGAVTGLNLFLENPKLYVNITKLDGRIRSPQLTVTQKNLSEVKQSTKYSGGGVSLSDQPYWTPIYTGKKQIGEIRNQLVGPGFIERSTAFAKSGASEDAYAVFDFSKGSTKFTYVYGGVRTMPFIDFSVGVYAFGESRLQSQLSLPFTDQIGSSTSPMLSQKGSGDISYSLSFSPTVLTPTKPSKFTVNIQALKKGQAYNSPYQRIRITALPLSKQARVDKISSQNSRLDYANDDNYTPLLPQTNFSSVFIDAESPGDFVIDDEINYHRAGLLVSYPYTRGELSHNQTDVEKASVEFDLINGQGSIDFDYAGGISHTRQISFLVQPINFVFQYPGWTDDVEINLEKALTNATFDWLDKRRTTPTYREEQNLKYPWKSLPFKLEESGLDCGRLNFAEPCGYYTLGLYGDTWMPTHLSYGKNKVEEVWGDNAITSLEFAQTNYVIASIPIGQPGFNFWLWVLIGHLLKIVILSARLIYLKSHHGLNQP